MPMIVVGADTEAGRAILSRVTQTDREVRVFVSDEDVARALRELGYKVATGDVSDESHVEGAALRCFTAVLIAEAAGDNRERSFAEAPSAVLAGWARAVGNAGVRRVIWVSANEPPETRVAEVAVVEPSDPALAERVLALDEAASID